MGNVSKEGKQCDEKRKTRFLKISSLKTTSVIQTKFGNLFTRAQTVNWLNSRVVPYMNWEWTINQSHHTTSYYVISGHYFTSYNYISVTSWYLHKPDEDWYWPVEISQLNSISRCLISPCKSLLDYNVFNLIYFDWSRSFWIRRWARLIVHGFCSGFLP